MSSQGPFIAEEGGRRGGRRRRVDMAAGQSDAKGGLRPPALTLRMEEAHQGMRIPLAAGPGKGTDSSLEPPALLTPWF